MGTRFPGDEADVTVSLFTWQGFGKDRIDKFAQIQLEKDQ